eukprot:scaffold52569_cov66-Cyclotella_meneghiniana.AAC.4
MVISSRRCLDEALGSRKGSIDKQQATPPTNTSQHNTTQRNATPPPRPPRPARFRSRPDHNHGTLACNPP